MRAFLKELGRELEIDPIDLIDASSGPNVVHNIKLPLEAIHVPIVGDGTITTITFYRTGLVNESGASIYSSEIPSNQLPVVL